MSVKISKKDQKDIDKTKDGITELLKKYGTGLKINITDADRLVITIIKDPNAKKVKGR